MTCPLCNTKNTIIIAEFNNVCPVGNFIFSSVEEAQRIPKAKIKLHRCTSCTFVFNAAFDADLLDYSNMEYNNSQTFSDIFQKHLSSVEENIKKHFDLKSKKIVEVGCGDGTFLKRFKNENQCFGFDPATKASCEEENLNIKKDFYDGAIENVDLLVSRHTFEHIPRPEGFIETILKSKPKNLYIEIPRLEFILESKEYYAITYEHCSWYSQESLEKVLNLHGYQVLEFEKQFGEEFLGVYASLDLVLEPIAEEPYNLDYYLDQFCHVNAYYQELDQDLIKWKNEGKNIIIWGVAGKGVSLTTNMINSSYISYAIDNNPVKDQKFIPINSIPIYHPNTVKRMKLDIPDIILITNSKYKNEIAKELDQIFEKRELELVLV